MRLMRTQQRKFVAILLILIAILTVVNIISTHLYASINTTENITNREHYKQRTFSQYIYDWNTTENITNTTRTQLIIYHSSYPTEHHTYPHIVQYGKHQVTTFRDYRIIKGIVIPTRRAPHNWYGAGIDPNCLTLNNIMNISAATVINISVWRQDGMGANLRNTMAHIAFALSNPSKYHFYYFPWLYRSMWKSNQVYDLTAIEAFINIGSQETNILNESCICCIWGNHILPQLRNIPEGSLYNETVRAYLRKSYYQNKQNLIVSSYTNNTFNVAVHIRRGDILEERRYLSFNYFISIMNYICGSNYNDITVFHIYSERNFNYTHFEHHLSSSMYSHSQCVIKYHVDTPLNLTFHGMVTADALIASISDLSYSAAVLSSSKYIFYPGAKQLKYWIKCTKKPKCVDSNGELLL